jgi:hypothetical protein
MAATILSNAIAIGNLIASVIPGLVFGDESSMSKEQLQKKFTLYLVIISTVVTLLAIPLILVAKTSPPTPPS